MFLLKERKEPKERKFIILNKYINNIIILIYKYNYIKIL